MGSLNKQYSRQKLLGEIYTPSHIVGKILDDAGFSSAQVIGKRILDPACGDGQFLIEIVRRIIRYAPPDKLQSALQCVHGWDIDAGAGAKCIANLDSIVAPLGLEIKWNIKICDALQNHRRPDLFFQNENGMMFDYIFGNPPYIRIQHLEESQRHYIQENYDCCKSGSTDIFIAFYELCLNLLSEDGLCGLITPNTFLFTEAARAMRGKFADKITQLTNYGDIQLFDKISTYSAIVLFGKRTCANFKYEHAINARNFVAETLKNKTLGDEIWRLGTGAADGAGTPETGRRLGGICEIHVGLTTLCDKVYIFPVHPADSGFVFAETKHRGAVRIEEGILRPIVKASKLKNESQPVTERILFPYVRENGKHVIMSEEMLKNKFPLAHAYLLSARELLDRRDNGKPNPVAWYAFGRTQGLDSVWGTKILFSPIAQKPNFIFWQNPDCAFYSGYCIKYNGNIPALLAQLNSKSMEKFIAASSRDFRGGWKAYNKKVLVNFPVAI
jgi:hypothetical protein